MEIGAPALKAQGRQFLSPFTERLSPESIFASKKLYVSIPAGEGALLIRKGALFVHDKALLSRYVAPPASRGAPLARNGAFSPMTAPAKNAPLDQNGAPRTCSPSPMKILDSPLGSESRTRRCLGFCSRVAAFLLNYGEGNRMNGEDI